MKKLASLLSLCCLAALPLCAQTSRFTGFVGGGFTPPLNPIGSRVNNGWNINAGGGVNLTNRVGLLLNFTLNEMGINRTFLDQAGAPDGAVRVWGFTLNPVFHVLGESPVDLYFTGGGGIYKRTVEYTQPAIGTGTFFDPWFGFYPAAFPTTEVIGSFGQYKGGLNIGTGVAVKLGQSRVSAFAEARYHHIFTRNVATDILPVTFGIRW